jgi:hypothetical protein
MRDVALRSSTRPQMRDQQQRFVARQHDPAALAAPFPPKSRIIVAFGEKVTKRHVEVRPVHRRIEWSKAHCVRNIFDRIFRPPPKRWKRIHTG